MASSKRFGYEWNKYAVLLPQYEEQFLKWVYPLKPVDFKGKVSLDAGCGMGRNSYWPLKYGAKYIYAFDKDERSLRAARENLKAYNNVKISYGDINEFAPIEPVDIAFSIGVIHHLSNPARALHNLAKRVKPGGKLLIWVYGYKGNKWIVNYINPIRKHITSKLPPGIVHTLAYASSVPLYLWLKLTTPKAPYLRQLKRFSFKHIHSIAFDQMIPAIANYWTREEALQLLTSIPELTNVQIYPVNDVSWTVIGTKK